MLGSRLCRILTRATLPAHPLAKEVSAVSSLRGIFTSTPRFGLKEDFEASVSSLNDLPEADNQTKLKFYALYKQATHGVCDAKKPGAFDFVGKAKWEAWKNLGEMPKEEAMKAYVDLVSSLLPKKSTSSSEGTSSSFDDITLTKSNGVLTLKLNRPKKMNSMTLPMYNFVTDTLNNAASDDSVKLAVLTGSGPYYSSGTDMSAFVGPNPPPLDDAIDVMIRFVDSFITFPKPLLAAVNGPALGISVTTLGLCDFVYASSRATFQTPFSATGQSPEGCSSLTFPELMGVQKSSELLLLGKKITAQEAFSYGLVSRVFAHESFQSEVDGVVKKLSSLPPRALQAGKGLVQERRIPLLKEVNRREAQVLRKRWEDQEYKDAVAAFLSRKK